MKRLCLTYTLLMLLTMFLPATAEELSVTRVVGETPAIQVDTIEAMLLSKLNAARTNPARVFESMGKAVEAFTPCYEDKQSYLYSGMRGLELDTRLVASAEQYALEMVETDNFSETALDGSVSRERIQGQGYLPALNREAIGVVFFQNYMSKQKAAEALFENIIENEIACGDAPGRTTSLFNPQLRDVGIAIKNGALRVGQRQFNYYLAVCDSAVAMPGVPVSQLFFRINYYRESPKALSNFLTGGDAECSEEEVEGLPSMVMNLSLAEFAGKRAEKLVDNIVAWVEGRAYFQSLDTDSLQSEMALAGYNAGSCRETINFMVSYESNPDIALDALLRKMLGNETETVPVNRVMLNPGHRDGAVVFLTIPLVLENDSEEAFIYILAAESATALD